MKKMRDLNIDFTFHYCLFGTVRLPKNADCNKYGYRGYSIGFDALSICYFYY